MIMTRGRKNVCIHYICHTLDHRTMTPESDTLLPGGLIKNNNKGKNKDSDSDARV